MSVTLSNGLKVPALGYGTWQIAKDVATKAVYTAIKNGYRHIDCAQIYGNEKEVGAAINKAISEGIVKREDIWVTSKVWNDDHANVASAINVTLTNLGLDYLDLYLIHWPVHWVKGSAGANDSSCTNISTYKQLEALVDAGKTRSIGVSNYTAEQFKEVYEAARIKPVMNQVESHPAFPQQELQKAIYPLGAKITAYSAFNQNDKNPATRIDLFTNPDVVAIAQKYGKTPGQVLLRFQIDQDRCVIPKSITESRIIENFGALSFQLTKEEINTLNNQTKRVRGVNPQWGPNGTPLFKDAQL